MSHVFSSLQNDEHYFIEFQATSMKGILTTTGLLPFYVSYIQPKVNVQLVSENIKNAGIRLSWNVVQIIGKSEGDIEFIDNEKVDVLRGKVYFDEGLDIAKNFTLKVWLESPILSNFISQFDLLEIKGSNGTYTLQYWSDNKFKLIKEINGYKTIWISNIVVGTNFCVVLQQVNDLCNVIAYEI